MSWQILVVEDEEMVSAVLTHILEKDGWRVTTDSNGNDALTRMARNQFDLILCDLDLGAGPSGLDVLARRQGLSQNVPFFILTAHGTIDRCQEALKLGATGFLEKPLAPAHLLATLNGAITSTAVPLDRSDDALTIAPDTAGSELVRSCLRIIDRKFSDPEFCVAELASLAGVSPEHLARVFRDRVGRSPLELIQRTRVTAAENLLTNSRLSVYEVGLESGYRNSSDLGRWFRRFNDQTPSDWRGRRPPIFPKSET